MLGKISKGQSKIYTYYYVTKNNLILLLKIMFVFSCKKQKYISDVELDKNKN